MNIAYYQDAGHGWMKVKREFIVFLGIENSISAFSYQREDYVYLEEDCDAEKLLKAMEEKNIKYSLKPYRTNNSSKIRRYECYSKIPPIKQNYISLLAAMTEWLSDDANMESRFIKETWYSKYTNY